MAAVFTDLHDVAQVLAEHIREEIGIDDVQAGDPRTVGSSTEAGARITLLYTTPQPGHRNDPLEPQPDGTRRPPPLALSCFYLITTSGADADDPIAAHHTLGRIMTLYHDRPALQLPLSANGNGNGAFTELGEGLLTVLQVPITLDQIDKIWTSLDVQLQPWALFEVSPVQLVSQLDDTEPAPLVRPGGLGLEVRAGRRPLILRVTPASVRAGGRVRIDAVAGAPGAVSVDGIEVPLGDDSLVVAATGSPMLLALDDGGLEALAPGTHPLTIHSEGFVSRRSVLRVAANGAATVDAPEAFVHDPDEDLVLTGANLGGAQEAFLWPDVGVAAPSDVHAIPVNGVDAGSVTIPAASGLATLPRGRGLWRLTIRVAAHVYTPYVLVELGS